METIFFLVPFRRSLGLIISHHVYPQCFPYMCPAAGLLAPLQSAMQNYKIMFNNMYIIECPLLHPPQLLDCHCHLRNTVERYFKQNGVLL